VKVHTLVMRTYQGEARLEQDGEPVKKG
jgi:hypothetical protein